MAKYSFFLFTALMQFYGIFFNAHPFLAQKGYSLVHFILTPRLFDKRRYSSAQLDTTLVNSTELSQLTPAVTNPKS